MRKKTFNQAGDTDEKVTWNAAGTRKWKMTYTLLEVQPSWRHKSKDQARNKDGNTEPVGAESAPKKPAKAKRKKATKAKTKPKTSRVSKARKAKSKK